MNIAKNNILYLLFYTISDCLIAVNGDFDTRCPTNNEKGGKTLCAACTYLANKEKSFQIPNK